MGHITHPKGALNFLNRGLVARRKDLVNVSNYSTDIGRTVGCHVLTNRFKVSPVVAETNQLEAQGRGEKAYRIASTTPDEEYPAQKTPGWLLKLICGRQGSPMTYLTIVQLVNAPEPKSVNKCRRTKAGLVTGIAPARENPGCLVWAKFPAVRHG